MPDDHTDAESQGRRPVAEVLGASTRVNVAFPFSQIRVEEPSKDLVELAAVVELLAEVVAGAEPGSGADVVLARARSLAARLR